jgi:hypothetical protein
MVKMRSFTSQQKTTMDDMNNPAEVPAAEPVVETPAAEPAAEPAAQPAAPSEETAA